MKNIRSKILISIILIGAYIAIAFSVKPEKPVKPADSNYWFQGKAEITSYELDQFRYGENHPGEAVMIFVTEDFSKSKQVKLDNPYANTKDAVKVMKLNYTKKFYTGIYPYSMMKSTFTSMDTNFGYKTLKTSGSIQEWCGNTFTQLNLTEDGYRGKHFSYFEKEGDKSYELDYAILEDEIWNQIRIAPENLPVGDFKIIPGIFHSRLKHSSIKVEHAEASLEEKNNLLYTYTLIFKQSGRQLNIEFSKEFPYTIESWTEKHSDGMVTTARLKSRIMTDYWNQNSNDDVEGREALNLMYN